MSDLESRGIACSKNKGADQLHGLQEADLHLYFRKCKKSGLFMMQLIIIEVIYSFVSKEFYLFFTFYF